jgi:hypothetical protein
VLWEHEAAGSNPAAPIIIRSAPGASLRVEAPVAQPG